MNPFSRFEQLRPSDKDARLLDLAMAKAGFTKADLIKEYNKEVINKEMSNYAGRMLALEKELKKLS